MSLGDAIDRLTILSKKIACGEEEAIQEHTYLTQSITKLGLILSGALLASVIRISQMNMEIWALENEIRKADDPVDKLGLEEIGRRALKIRDFNRKRVNYKNEINRLSEMGFREFKIQHRSQ